MPETTDQYHHIPIKSKDDFVDTSFKTITIGNETDGIQAVIGKLKNDPTGSTQVQKYLFDVKKWSMVEAEKWVGEHKKRSGMEKRSCDGNFRISIDDKIVTLRGTAIPYNKLSVNPIGGFPPGAKEKILPGAFKRSIASDSNIFMLWNHELKYVLGRTSNGMLRLTEDQNGVQFENIPPDVQWVKDLIPSIKRGDISNMSFKFAEDAGSWTREGKEYVRNVRDATLFEISVVTFPVYESTSVYARSAELMIVDGVVLPDLISEERKAEADLNGFKLVEEKFNNLKKFWL